MRATVRGCRASRMRVVVKRLDCSGRAVGEPHGVAVGREAGAVGAAHVAEKLGGVQVGIQPPNRRDRGKCVFVHAAGDEAALPIGAAVVQPGRRQVWLERGKCAALAGSRSSRANPSSKPATTSFHEHHAGRRGSRPAREQGTFGPARSPDTMSKQLQPWMSVQ